MVPNLGIPVVLVVGALGDCDLIASSWCACTSAPLIPRRILCESALVLGEAGIIDGPPGCWMRLSLRERVSVDGGASRA